jgi:hypothetical protein
MPWYIIKDPGTQRYLREDGQWSVDSSEAAFYETMVTAIFDCEKRRVEVYQLLDSDLDVVFLEQSEKDQHRYSIDQPNRKFGRQWVARKE